MPRSQGPAISGATAHGACQYGARPLDPWSHQHALQGTSFDVGKALQRLWTKVFSQQVVEVAIESQEQQPAGQAPAEPAPAAEATEAVAGAESAETEPEVAEAEPAPAAAVAAEPEAAPAMRYEATCVSDISKVGTFPVVLSAGTRTLLTVHVSCLLR